MIFEPSPHTYVRLPRKTRTSAGKDPPSDIMLMYHGRCTQSLEMHVQLKEDVLRGIVMLLFGGSHEASRRDDADREQNDYLEGNGLCKVETLSII